MDALCDGVECAGICEIKVGVKEDGGYGIEGCDEFGEAGRGIGGSCLEEAVPFWCDGAEVGIKVLASHAGEDSGRDGREMGMGLWGSVTLVGVVEYI